MSNDHDNADADAKLRTQDSFSSCQRLAIWMYDCDLDTGLTPSGGAPFTGNAQILNAWLAVFANSSTQIGLLLDCACLLNTALVIPAGGNVEIT